jgi:hypothetical protein
MESIRLRSPDAGVVEPTRHAGSGSPALLKVLERRWDKNAQSLLASVLQSLKKRVNGNELVSRTGP